MWLETEDDPLIPQPTWLETEARDLLSPPSFSSCFDMDSHYEPGLPLHSRSLASAASGIPPFPQLSSSQGPLSLSSWRSGQGLRSPFLAHPQWPFE